MTACLPALGKAPRVVEAAAPKQVANGTAATATAAAGGGASTVEDALPGSFCAELWQSVSGSPGSVFSSVMSHPFLTELMEGTLDEATFKGYLVQGCLYLREYGRALAVLASKAPRPAWGAFLARCVQEAWQEEALFHQNLLMSHYGTTLEHEIAAATLSPSSLLYSSFVLSTVHERCFAEGSPAVLPCLTRASSCSGRESSSVRYDCASKPSCVPPPRAGLAAILPCFILYLEMGKQLVAAGSPHPLYQRFIDRFGGTDYELLTLEAAAMANEAAAELGDVQRQRAAAIFAKGCRLEYMFFDGAYRQEQWPL